VALLISGGSAQPLADALQAAAPMALHRADRHAHANAGDAESAIRDDRCRDVHHARDAVQGLAYQGLSRLEAPLALWSRHSGVIRRNVLVALFASGRWRIRLQFVHVVCDPACAAWWLVCMLPEQLDRTVEERVVRRNRFRVDELGDIRLLTVPTFPNVCQRAVMPASALAFGVPVAKRKSRDPHSDAGSRMLRQSEGECDHP
jgi:hypothetical protein